jgi:hypothetical protein
MISLLITMFLACGDKEEKQQDTAVDTSAEGSEEGEE